MLMLANWFESAFRSLFFFLDKIVYSFISTLYDFIRILASQRILQSEEMVPFANNIYALLAIFMLFRLAFVLLQAIIDPDKLTNKEKGFTKIMTRFITAMFLIVAIPWIFDYAYRLQTIILKNEIIEKIVFGGDIKEYSSPGNAIARATMETFYYCKPEEGEDIESNPDYKPNNPDPGTYPYICDLNGDYDTAFGASNLIHNFSGLTDKLNLTEGKDYKFNYSAVISTICGVVMLLMIITFSFDVAVRVVKLSFLQLISPIAIIGYIEPGGGKFKEWQKLCLSTYVNLFVRLLAIDFIGYVIALIDPINGFTPVDLDGNKLPFVMASFVRIFIILGCLLFAKEAPKMLMDMLGIKDSGFGGLNPLKKLGAVPLIGGAAAAGIGAGLSMGLGATMKGTAGVGGMLRGGLSSKFHHGSFVAGAFRGGGAAMKNVPLKGKFGAQAKGFFGAGRKASDAGATSALGRETHTGVTGRVDKIKEAFNTAAGEYETDRISGRFQKAINESSNGRITSLFSNNEVKNAFDDYSDKNDAKKSAMKALNGYTGDDGKWQDGYQQKYDKKKLEYDSASNNLNSANSAFSQASTSLQNALAAKNAVQEQAKSLEEARDAALQGGNNFDYQRANNAYNSYIGSQDYTNAMSNYSSAESKYANANTALSDARDNLVTLQGELQGAQTELLTGQADLRQAEKDFTDYESKLNTVLERPGNKSDSEIYKSYKAAKSARLINDKKKP